MREYENYTLDPVPWIEKMPVHWKLVRGKHLYQKMQRPTSNIDEVITCFRDGTVTLRKNRRITGFTESLKEIGYQGIKKGDLVIHVMDAFAGAVGVSDSDGKGTPVYSVCQAKGDINNQYYALLLREMARTGFIQSLYRGIRERSSDFRFEVFAAQLYPVPPRPEQDQIVRFLDWKAASINKLISIKKKQLVTIQEFVNKQFQLISSCSPQQSRLKHIVSLCNDFVEISPTQYYMKTGMYNRGRGIFRREAILGENIGDSSFQKIHSDCVMISGQFAWEGATYITTEEDEAGIASHRYYLLAPKKEVPSEYIWCFLMSDYGQMQMKLCSHGAAGRNRPLNIKELLNVYIPIPQSDSKLNALVRNVQSSMKLRKNVLLQEQKLTEMRNHLISDVVTGKIDVRGIEIPEYEFVEEETDCDVDDEEETEGQEEG